MIRSIWTASARSRDYLRYYMPTNILLDAIRTRRGLRWGIPAMFLAVPYLYAASLCTTIVDHGGPGWLHVLVVLFIWNALKMLWIGPISVVLLARVRAREYRHRRAELTAAETQYPSFYPPQTIGKSPETIRYT